MPNDHIKNANFLNGLQKREFRSRITGKNTNFVKKLLENSKICRRSAKKNANFVKETRKTQISSKNQGQKTYISFKYHDKNVNFIKGSRNKRNKGPQKT